LGEADGEITEQNMIGGTLSTLNMEMDRKIYLSGTEF
jgi:hypothetical protein